MKRLTVNIRQQQDIPAEVVAAAGGDEIAARILYGRGYDTPEKIKEFFLHGYIPVQTADIPDMDKAVQRVMHAIEAGERICVYGDYDVDGVTSTAILSECLKELGADFTYHVPDRFTEGYGMNMEVINTLASQGVKLIITCDCGISNVEEINNANRLGMDVIVTDHHSIPPELPHAYCIINPKLFNTDHKAYNVSGAVVAYYLARALLEEAGMGYKSEVFQDLLALSIVADVVPLSSENKYLMIKGLERLSQIPREGLRSLFELCSNYGMGIDEDFIGFQAAPRINAAGRLDTARKAVELLMADSRDTASIYSQELNSLNILRKEVESGIVKQAEEQIKSRRDSTNIVVVYNDSWHHGVIGIAAGRICEKYNRPAVLLTLKEDGETVVGSARAPEGVSIYDILNECSACLDKFGGHSAAAGLSLHISNLQTFIRQIERVSLRYHIESSKSVDIDLEVKLDRINESLINSINKLSPFGEGFSKPIFISRGVDIISNLPIKNIGRRMMVEGNLCKLQAVFWDDPDFNNTCRGVDIVYTLQESLFRGNREIKLNILHIIEPETDTNTLEELGQDVIINDLRSSPLEYIPLQGETVYIEGMKVNLRVRVSSRYELSNISNLVLYSAPPSLEVLKEILREARPQKLTLVFKYQRETHSQFIQQAFDLIKYIVKQGQRRTSYTELACLLGTTLEITDLLIKFLYFSGLIEFEEVYGDLIIIKGSRRKQPEAERYRKAIGRLVQEVNAFRAFIRSTSVENIMKLFK